MCEREHYNTKEDLSQNIRDFFNYFAGSCSGAPIDIVRQYIEQQNTPH